MRALNTETGSYAQREKEWERAQVWLLSGARDSHSCTRVLLLENGAASQREHHNNLLRNITYITYGPEPYLVINEE